MEWDCSARACLCDVCCSFFFFQAEDGIRDLTVTGVQTCALPIYFFFRAGEAVHVDLSARRARQRGLKSIARFGRPVQLQEQFAQEFISWFFDVGRTDRKSTRLNSSHSQISYAVFCLKKKKMPSCTNFANGDLQSPAPSTETFIERILFCFVLF